MPVSNGECPTDLLGLNINFSENEVFIHMVNKDKWQFDATFTVRVDGATKDRLWAEAKARDTTPSEYIRDVLTRAKLPEDLLARLSPETRARVEKLAARSGKEVATVLLDLVPQAIKTLLDTVSYGV